MTAAGALLALLAVTCPQESRPPAAGAIHGRVVDARHEPVVQATVEARAAG